MKRLGALDLAHCSGLNCKRYSALASFPTHVRPVSVPGSHPGLHTARGLYVSLSIGVWNSFSGFALNDLDGFEECWSDVVWTVAQPGCVCCCSYDWSGVVRFGEKKLQR